MQEPRELQPQQPPGEWEYEEIRWQRELSELSSGRAVVLIEDICAILQEVRRHEIGCTMRLGQLLVRIRDRHLWETILGGYQSWGDFMELGFPRISGRAERTGYDCIALAESPTLSTMRIEELEKLSSLSLARHLAKLERHGFSLTPEMLQKAKGQEIDGHQQPITLLEFKRQTGSSSGYLARIWVENQARGEDLQAIGEMLAQADDDAVRMLRALLTREPRLNAAAPTPNTKVNFILANCWQELKAMEDRERHQICGPSPGPSE